MITNLTTITPLAVAVDVPGQHGKSSVIFGDADIARLSGPAWALLASAYTKPSPDPVKADAATVAAVSAALEDLAARRSGLRS